MVYREAKAAMSATIDKKEAKETTLSERGKVEVVIEA